MESHGSKQNDEKKKIIEFRELDLEEELTLKK